MEQVDWRNNYEGNNLLSAGYVGGNLPLGKLNVYAGVRFEYNRMELVSHTQKNEESPTSVFYTYDDFFPSVNAAYRLNDKRNGSPRRRSHAEKDWSPWLRSRFS